MKCLWGRCTSTTFNFELGLWAPIGRFTLQDGMMLPCPDARYYVALVRHDWQFAIFFLPNVDSSNRTWIDHAILAKIRWLASDSYHTFKHWGDRPNYWWQHDGERHVQVLVATFPFELESRIWWRNKPSLTQPFSDFDSHANPMPKVASSLGKIGTWTKNWSWWQLFQSSTRALHKHAFTPVLQRVHRWYLILDEKSTVHLFACKRLRKYFYSML